MFESSIARYKTKKELDVAANYILRLSECGPKDVRIAQVYVDTIKDRLDDVIAILSEK